MRIVAASMHHPLMNRFIRDLVFFLNRQSIHIRYKRYRMAIVRLCTLHPCQQTVTADISPERNPFGFEKISHIPACILLVIGQFRMPVQILIVPYDFRIYVLGLSMNSLCDIHCEKNR
jgi:hypothetical protein